MENRLETVCIFGLFLELRKKTDRNEFYFKTLKRFNTLLTENSSRRSEIDNLRVERQRYEDLFQKAEKRLKELREKLVTCIEHSVTAYEQRFVESRKTRTKSEFCFLLFSFQQRIKHQSDSHSRFVATKIESFDVFFRQLSGKAENDRAAAEAEIKELERQISHDRKLREFMKLKSQERQEDEDLVAFHKRKGFQIRTDFRRRENFLLFSFSEAEAAEKRRKEKEEHSVEAYESKFNRIKEISGEQDLEKLVDKFIEGFSLVSFSDSTKLDVFLFSLSRR